MRPTVLVAALVLAGCSLLPSPASGAYDIHVENATTLEIGLFVNGVPAGTFEPGRGGVVAADRAGPLPWDVEARTAGGRVLVRFAVEEGAVDVEGNAQRGRGGRADLSCGRLDVYVGPPVIGPAPGPGEPGDCVP